MSAIIVHIGARSVHVVTDTAVLTTTGTVANFMTKVYPLPHANMVIACRGHIFAIPIAAVHLQRAGATFDEIRANAERVLQPVFLRPDPALLSAIENAGATHDIEITVAGISETRGPLAYVMRVVQERHGLAWAIDEIEGDDAIFGPFTPEIESELEKRIEETGSGRLEQLAWLVDRSRLIKSPVFGCGEDMAQIGGQAVLTKISADAIETRILGVWPDKIGETIKIDSGWHTSRDLPAARADHATGRFRIGEGMI